jgi:peptidoglycan/LPS O-acetylase OafA/YrhL
VRTAPESAEVRRIPALDFTKGALVLFMVLYHWLNYFYGIEGRVYSYLRFLTPSFILITGFLISHVHLTKYAANSSRLAKRLFIRGLKLLAVFIGLNALLGFFVSGSFVRSVMAGRAVIASLCATFLTGNAVKLTGGKIASFGILVPIAYVLILSSLLVMVRPLFGKIFLVAGTLSLICMVVWNLYFTPYPYPELVTMGLLGIMCGYASARQVDQVVGHAWVVVFLYSVYLIVITLWKESYYTQMIGTFLTTALIYSIGARAKAGGVQSKITQLGKYSLFGYISQIAILQLLRAGIAREGSNDVVLAGSLLAGGALTMVAVEVMNWSRARSSRIDIVYRWIFA